MKTTIALIIFLSFASFSFAQTSDVLEQNDEIVNVIKDNTTEARKASTSSRLKSKVKKISNKKSNEIISIKAYRKSLHVKVKTVKLC